MGSEPAATYEALIEALSDEQLESLSQRLKRPDRDAQLAELRQRFSELGVALVIGAGVSVDAGVPTWAPLLDALVIRAFTESLGVDHEKAGLLARVYTRAITRSPPIQARYLSNMLGRDVFIERLREIVYGQAPNGRIAPLLASIARLCSADHGAGVREIVTYNFDRLLEEALDTIGRPYTVVDRDTFPVGTELPIHHVHGWLGRAPSDEEWIVFAEDEFHEKFADPFDWSNVVQLNALSHRCCLFVGMSIEDPDLRRLLDAVSGHKRGPRPQHFALLPRTDDEALERSLTELAWNDGMRAARDRRALMRRIGWMRELADLSKEQVLTQLGVSSIWFERFEELPQIIDALHPKR